MQFAFRYPIVVSKPKGEFSGELLLSSNRHNRQKRPHVGTLNAGNSNKALILNKLIVKNIKFS